MKRTIEQIREDLKSAYRPDLYQDLFDSLVWVHDVEPTTRDNLTLGQDFPIYPALKPKKLFAYTGEDHEALPESRLRDTANACTLMQAKLRPANIKPEYIDIESPIFAEARTGFFSKRCTGTASIPGYTEAFSSACFDMLVCGMGFVQLGTKTNKATGKKYTTLKRHRPLNMLWDPMAPTIGEAEWMCPVHLMSVAEAESYTGLSGLDKHAKTITTATTYGSRRVVQVFEYFSYPCNEKETPTRAVIVGSMGSEDYRVEKNEFGMIPISVFEFLYVDGMEFPQGAIYLQQHLEIQADAYRKRLKNIADLHAMIALNPDGIDGRDLKTIRAAIDGRGEFPSVFFKKPKLEAEVPAFEAYAGAEVPKGLMELYELTQREFRAISGIDEPSRGGGYENVDTKYEAQLIAQSSGAVTKYGSFKLAIGAQNLFQKFGQFAKQFDTDPVMVPVDGTSVLINDPENPELSAAALFEQDSSVLVAEEELYGAAHDMKTKERIGELNAALALPGVNQAEITKEILRLMNLDVSVMMAQPGAIDPAQAAMAGGQQVPQQAAV